MELPSCRLNKQWLLFLLITVVTVTILLMSNISLVSWRRLLSIFVNSPLRQPALSALGELKQHDLTVAKHLNDLATNVRVVGLNCEALYSGDENETKAAQRMISNASTPLSDSFYLNLTSDCVNFRNQRGYIMSSLTEEEEQFPIAFSLMVYKDPEMVERLLRAIYRPQNVYCIHVDSKSPIEFFKTISAIANCFTNVFIASRRIDVVWAEFSVLGPELLCMEELWRYKKWKYFINLTGQEFPLKTNYELVQILTAYNGSIDVATTVKRAQHERWPDIEPPYGLLRVKGSVHIVVTRSFVDYMLHNETAEELLNYTKKTIVPDEMFFAMLNANPKLGIKGTYKGIPEPSDTRPFVARFKNWDYLSIPCAGRFVRWICILSTGDLPLLGNATEMFANKFYLQEDRVVIGCLEERHFNNTRDEYLGTKTFNTTYYANLDFVKNRIE